MIRWSDTREHCQGARWHLWAELLDESGQPIRMAGDDCAFIVAAFGPSKDDAVAKIESDKVRVMARYLGSEK